MTAGYRVVVLNKEGAPITSHDDTIRVVTEHGDPANFRPYRLARSLPAAPRLVRAPLEALGLWRTARRQPGVTAFVTYGNRTGFALAALQAILSPLVPPRTHVMFDLLLERRRGGLPGLFDRLKMWAFTRGGVRAVVWGADDGDVFAREYNLPRDRFQFHPYHTTLEGFEFDVVDDGYIFAGGNNGRDYQTLLAAVKDLDFPVTVATTDPRIPPLAAGMPHVTVRGVTPAEFRRLLARCTLLVEAHPRDFIRTAGHQTLLNAMGLGKPIVLADARSAVGYLESGREGLVVEAGDAPALAGAIAALLADPDARARAAQAGRERLRSPIYGTAQHMQSIYNGALRLEHRRLGRAGEPDLIESYGPASEGLALWESST